MIDPTVFLSILQKRGVTFFAGVPDSLLQPFAARLNEMVPAQRHVVAANEGGAIGLVAGHHLATGAIGCAYMQNSGLGNAINPLTSLTDAEVYAIPALLLIGWRGELRDGAQMRDDPQHKKQGRITLDLLDCLEIPYAILDAGTGDVDRLVGGLLDQARAASQPVALVVRRDAFASVDEESAAADLYPLTREEGLRAVLEALPTGAVIVSTTGKASRELYEMRREAGADPDQDFLTVGSMGHALQIAAGVALAQPGQRVVCIDGDGALIMHMGGMATSAKLPNLLHIVMNNGAHESAGGQSSAGFAIDMPGLAKACGYAAAHRTQSRPEILRAIDETLAGGGSGFIEIRTNARSRSDLGRPHTPPRQAKLGFMRAFAPEV